MEMYNDTTSVVFGPGNEMFMNTSNGTGGLSCSAKKILGRPISIDPTIVNVFRYLQIIVLVVGFPIGLILNSLVIFLIAKFKSLQQTTFFLALQVVVVDLLLTAIIFPTTSANMMADRWLFGDLGCSSLGFVSFVLRNMRNFLMFVFVTDRLLTVFAPFWYYRKMNRQYVIVPLSIAAWVFAAVYGIAPVILGCHAYSRIAWGCTINKGCMYPKACIAYKVSSVALSYIIGGLIPLVMYSVLFCKSWQIRKKIPKYKFSKMAETAVDRASNSAKREEGQNNDEKRKHSMISIFSNSTNDSSSGKLSLIRKRMKKGERATVTFALLFVALSGISFPTIFFFIIGQTTFFGVGVPPPEWFTGITMIFRTMFNFLVIIDPIAIMRNRDVTTVLQESYQILKFRLLKRARPVEATNYNHKLTTPSRKGGVRKSTDQDKAVSADINLLTVNENTCSTSQFNSKRRVSYSQEVKVHNISDSIFPRGIMDHDHMSESGSTPPGSDDMNEVNSVTDEFPTGDQTTEDTVKNTCNVKENVHIKVDVIAEDKDYIGQKDVCIPSSAVNVRVEDEDDIDQKDVGMERPFVFEIAEDAVNIGTESNELQTFAANQVLEGAAKNSYNDCKEDDHMQSLAVDEIAEDEVFISKEDDQIAARLMIEGNIAHSPSHKLPGCSVEMIEQNVEDNDIGKENVGMQGPYNDQRAEEDDQIAASLKKEHKGDCIGKENHVPYDKEIEVHNF